ncbi:MAG: hypothetical protein Q8Q04_01210 [archaeon]|nr:hypothetical protein [archaeon]
MEAGGRVKGCYLCGILEEKALLYEGIHRVHGVVYVCRKCYFKDKIPLVDKKELDIEKINTRESVRARLSRIAHLNPEKKEEKKVSLGLEDLHLKDLVEKNFKKEVSQGIKSPPDLVDNFHWVVMRKRRSLKITKEKLAEAVMVPVIAIETLERGVLPKDYASLIKKIEAYLGTRIFRTSEIDHHNIINESRIPSGILIEDLKKKVEKDKDSYLDASDLSLEKINEVYGTPKEPEKKEESREDKSSAISFSKKPEEKSKEDYFIFKNPFKRKREEVKSEPKKSVEKKKKEDLSDEDISKLVWGK